MNNTNLLSLNIVFIPPAEISGYGLKLYKQIAAQNETSFNLDQVNNFPHITIYQLAIPEHNLIRLINTLEAVSLKIKPVKFRFKQFGEHDGFIGADFELSQEVKQAQADIVNAVNELREGASIVDYWNRKTDRFTEKQKELSEKFGFDNLFEIYNPHLTITNLPDQDRAQELTKQLIWTYEIFKSLSIGLYTLGDFGTCNKLLKSFNLAKED